MLRTMLAAGALTIAMPAYAQSSPLDPEITTWTNMVEAQLNANLDRTGRSLRDATGTVILKFNCTEEGRASGISIEKSSGDRRVDRAAIRAVEMVKSFHPLPHGLNHGQPIMAVLSYDTSTREHRRHAAEGRRIADAGNAWYRSERYARTELPPIQPH